MRRQSAADQSVSERAGEERFLLRTLGRLDIVRVDSANTTSEIAAGGKALALLTFLACASGRSAQRERLVELLWANASLESALQSIRQARSSLKRLAGHDLVLLEGATLILSPSVRCDRDDFRELLGAGDLEAAVSFYHGAFCESFAAAGADDFERWAEVERSALRSRCVEAIARLAAQALAQARATDALTLGDRLGQVDPLEERQWRIKLEALLLKHDNFSAALASMECSAWLVRENREPSRALRALLERIAQAPSEQLTRSREAVHAMHPDLVGRERQFGALLHAWEAVAAGRATNVAVVGSAGMGKSRLLHDMQERLASHRARVISLRALPAESGIAFSLISRIALTLAAEPGAAGLSESSVATLLTLNPSLAGHFRGVKAVPPHGDPTLAYIEALDDLLTVLTEDARLALLIDDLHWADFSSTQVLAAVGERHTNRRLLLVQAMRGRPGQTQRVPSSAQVITVGPLSIEETEAMLASIARLKEEHGRDWLLALHRATDGNPLIVLETLRLAMDGDLLSVGESAWVLHDERSFVSLLANRSMIKDRLSRLDTSAKFVALVLSVAGRPMEAEALSGAIADRTADGAAALRSLEVHDVAAPQSDGWSVAHDALAETLIAESDLSELRAARYSAARAMRSSAGGASLTAALHQYAELHEWDECVEVVSQLVRNGHQGEIDRIQRATSALATLPGDVAANEIRRRLPWSLRYPLRKLALASATVFACLATVASIKSGLFASASTSPTLLVFYGAESDPTLGVTTLSLDTSSMGVMSPIDLERGSRDARWPPSAGVFGAPGKASAVSRFYADSGGIDVALWYPGGREVRLTSSRGDDVASGWAPDGSALLIESSREGTMGHRAIYVVDPRNGTTTRISHGGTRAVSDLAATWSPDGSRIAFARRHFDLQPDELCVVDVDGANEHCRALAGRAVISTAGWVDSKHFVAWTDSSGSERTEIVESATGLSRRLFPDDRRCIASPDGIWWACMSSGHDTLTVSPVSAPARTRELLLPPAARSGQLGWPLSHAPTRVITSVELVSTTLRAPVGASIALRAMATTASDERVADPAVRWSVDDTTRGRIANGILTALRPGPIAVTATVGGWRGASIVVEAVSMPSGVLMRERWEPDYQQRWRLFGEPMPVTVRNGVGYAFWNQGDGDFVSGAYTLRNFSAADGMWTEADFQLPVTLAQWQYAGLSIESFDRKRLSEWDHRKGSRPGGQWSWCFFGYPSGEGIGALRRTQGGGGDISSRLGYSVDSLARGQWFRVLLQLFPDGRCATAIDGTPVYVTSLPSAAPDTAMVSVVGNSYATRVLVGQVTIGKGIRSDVAWDRLEPPAYRAQTPRP